jgi:hypothetical protein
MLAPVPMPAFSKLADDRDVRRLAAVVIVVEAYFLIAPQLPDLGDSDAAFFLTTIPALVAVSAIVIAARPLSERVGTLVGLMVLGAAVAALLSSPAPEAAAPFKALFAAGLGLALARLIPIGSIVYLLAIAVAIADTISVSVGPTNYLVDEEPEVVGYLALAIPAWGGTITQLGISDLVFFAVYLLTAWRFGLRRNLTAAMLTVSLVCSLAIATWTDWLVPALPLLSLALLAPNADLVWRALRTELRELD